LRHTSLEHREVTHCVTVVLGFFLQQYLEAAAHGVLLFGIRVGRLATTHPVEFGRGEPVDDTPHRGHADEPRREHLAERRGGFEGEAELTSYDEAGRRHAALTMTGEVRLTPGTDGRVYADSPDGLQTVIMDVDGTLTAVRTTGDHPPTYQAPR
jgi:hypothetical protein